MQRRFIAGIFGVAVLAVVVPVVAAPPGTEGFNESDVTAAEDCGEGNSLVLRHPESLWPPNHKYYEDLFALAEGDEGEDISVESYGFHDQYDTDTGTETNGSGNTADDITVNDNDASVTEGTSEGGFPEVVATESDQGSVQTDWRARAERSGTDQTGRDYTFGAVAEFSDGSCSVEVTFSVPHDMRASNRSE